MAPTTKRLLTGAATTAVGLAALLLAAVALRARLAAPTAAQRAQTDAPSEALESVGGGFPKVKISEKECASWCDANGGVTGYVNYIDEPIHIHKAERSDHLEAVLGGGGIATADGGGPDDAGLLGSAVGRKFGLCATELYALALAEEDAGLVVGACCCANANVEPGSMPMPTRVTCDMWCRAGGRGRGVMLGTAPFCEATCHETCHGGLPHGGTCAGSKKHQRDGAFGSYELSDHGLHCTTGSKICCCALHRPEGPPLAPDPWPYITCEKFCRSAGYRGQTFISGTSPSCEGVCRPHAKECVVANEQFEDLGAGCASGEKICNCY